MKTERVSLRLSERSVSDKIETSKNIVSSMNGNNKFTNPSPALAAITSATINLENAYIAAIDGGKSKTAFMHQQEAILDNLLLQLSNYVEATANAALAAGGDAQAVILSAGMDFKRAKNVAPLPLAPTGLTATSALEGEVELKWKSVKYARSYIVEISSDVSAIQGGTPNPNVFTPIANARLFIAWLFVDTVTKVKCTVPNLSSGTKYAFRVYALGTAGKGSKSVPVVVKVL
jgi:hypothetical protein